MNRLRLSLLAAALALPILVLGAMVAQAERDLRSAQVFSVPIRGVDPRDLLRGHYLIFEYDWHWAVAPPRERPITGQPLCLTAPVDAAKGPRASFATEGCLALVDGLYFGTTEPPVFRPKKPEIYVRPRLFIAEEYGPRLEQLLRDRKAVVTIDLAITDDRRALIRGWRVDGKEPRDYFR